MTLVLGITGGIASGKSTVSALFEANGAELVDADRIAREVVQQGSPGLRDVVAAFGAAVLSADGSLDRKALGALVFSDRAARTTLEALLHPRILSEVGRRLADARSHRLPLVVLDAALLVEMGLHRHCDRVLVVTAPVEARIARIHRRDGLPAEAAAARIAAQATDAERRAVADHVIDNDAGLDALRAAFAGLWPQFEPLLRP